MCKEINKPFYPCRKCYKLDGPQPGYYYKVINGFNSVVECECHKKWKAEQDLANKLISSNVDPDFTFNDYVGRESYYDLECLKQIASNPEKFIYKTMVYVYGPNGCQKTSMVQALGKELIIKNYSVYYILMGDLITNLVADFSNNDEAKEKKEYLIDNCMNCDFLIIDEAFDTKKTVLYSSGYQVPYLDQFIRNRFEIGKKSIIFVSNVHPDNIADVPPSKPGELPKQGFGTSLQSLIQRNTKQSILTFKDVWTENINKIDPHGLFKNAN